MLRILILLACLQPLVAQPAAYFPARNDWQRSAPATAGMDQAKIDDAIAWHRAHENKNPRTSAAPTICPSPAKPTATPSAPFSPAANPRA